MNCYKRLILVLGVLVSPALLCAQNVSDLIIAEVMAQPDSVSVVDDYGRRGGWIEIYNTSMGTVKFGGCYLTDDPAELRKSLIPKNDLATSLGPARAGFFMPADGPMTVLSIPILPFPPARRSISSATTAGRLSIS